MEKLKNKPIAVLISDIHYSIATLEVADKSMRLAINKANELYIPLIVAGDLHDTKAHLRGECVNAMLKTFRQIDEAYILVGNHDKINEKSEDNSLNFLSSDVVHIISKSGGPGNLYCIPYKHDVEELKVYLKTIPKGSTIIMHQGISGSNSGEYIQDKTALSKDDLAGFRVISGHYHQRQSFDLPDGGRFDYIGNPYTLNFGEANDPEKGFQILYNDGSLEFIPTNLRKHIIITDNLETNEYTWTSGPAYRTGDRNDIFWVKIIGSTDKLSTFNKKQWSKDRGVPQEFRLDLIPIEAKVETLVEEPKTQLDLFDSAIDSLTNTNDERKQRLKNLYKDLLT